MTEAISLMDVQDVQDVQDSAGSGAVVARACALCPDRSGGLLPGKGRVDPRGQEGLPRLRRAR